MLIRALVVVQDKAQGERLAAMLRKDGVLVAQGRRGETLWARLSAEPFDLVLVERSVLQDPVTESVQAIRSLPDEPDIVVLRPDDDSEERVRFLAAGCLAVIPWTLSDEALGDALSAFVQRRREDANRRLKAERPEAQHRLSDFVSSSPAMHRLMTLARRVVNADTSLLILGETGVGKEWLARAVHEEGPRSAGPFIAVNCGAIPETLLESELFGHEEGAFTGARKAHRGHFEVAHHGTVFLDEIAEMPHHVQVRLLRVLQERKIKRVGGEREIQVNVRVMAATNRDLEAEMHAGRFRPDLYYRLGVVALTVPPLRDRKEDIPDLVQNHLDGFRVHLGRRVSGISPAAMQALTEYDWPGNVRELINVMERAVLLCTASEIGLSDLPEAITGVSAAAARGDPAVYVGDELGEAWLAKPLGAARRELVASFERSYLAGLLARTHGRIAETARRAGVTPRSLFGKMRRYGLRKEDFKVR